MRQLITAVLFAYFLAGSLVQAEPLKHFAYDSSVEGGHPLSPHLVHIADKDVLAPEKYYMGTQNTLPDKHWYLNPTSPTTENTTGTIQSPIMACACASCVFDVGTSSLFPQGQGGIFYLKYAFQDQNRNWKSSSRAPAADNEDKQVRTHTVTAGVRYMFNQDWGLQVDVPFVHRMFKVDAGGSSPAVLNWNQLGDVRVRGIYTGFKQDMSLGVTFGAKFPTGSHTHQEAVGDIDRDTQVGTGSTDLLLGIFYRDAFCKSESWKWFAQADLDVPILTRGEFIPGYEVNSAIGLYYSSWAIKDLKITPVAQIIGSIRGSDRGVNSANPVASGFERILVAPGIEFNLHPIMIYADVEFPIYEYTRGNQLTSPVMFKIVMSYGF